MRWTWVFLSRSEIFGQLRICDSPSVYWSNDKLLSKVSFFKPSIEDAHLSFTVISASHDFFLSFLSHCSSCYGASWTAIFGRGLITTVWCYWWTWRWGRFMLDFLGCSRTQVLFVGPLIPLFWTSGDVCPGFQSQGGFPCLHASLPVHNGFLRFTSGVTPAFSTNSDVHCISMYTAWLARLLSHASGFEPPMQWVYLLFFS